MLTVYFLIPPNWRSQLGKITFSCFRLSRKLELSPPQLMESHLWHLLLFSWIPHPSHMPLVLRTWAASILVGNPFFITEHGIMINFSLESNRLHDIPVYWLGFNPGNYIQLPKFHLSLYGSLSLLAPMKPVLARRDCGIPTGAGCLFLASELMPVC